MGNSNSMINVTFDRPQPTVYHGGDIVSGRINMTIPGNADKIREIHLIVTGDVGYTTTRTTRMQNGQTERITDHHNIRIFEQKVTIGQGMSSGHNEAGGRINNRASFEPGQYVHPFSVRLPDSLPPTVHPTDYPFVRYELQLFIEKKWYNQDGQCRYPLRVYPRVNLLQKINSQCAVKFDTKRNDIKIRGIIQRAGLIPGEQTNLSLEIYNPNHVTIKRIDVCLIQRYEIEQCRRRLELIRFAVPELVNKNDTHIEASCPITVPIGISPTYNFKNKNGSTSVHVNLHYDIKLEVKVKGIFSDFDLQVPIIIGTDSAENPKFGNATKVPSLLADLNAIDMLELEARDDATLE
ncbi:unnamed protein product [Rotaria socialis]|uniref:Arrestin C-terminal-like domain-containing protein n=2 Tax=Rotaria socialis TaxID=392032 RepID=A0A820TR09_9BILA|nr:unnamed protein product [Rotaria socialis]CAF3504702.1 unnamed protein product [Rotaria socialis]CAF4471907.1 unnamed protein product [Rotaria socialis]